VVGPRRERPNHVPQAQRLPAGLHAPPQDVDGAVIVR
jgi:hypothetical protein